MRVRYNHDELVKELRDKYKQLYGKTPSQVANNVIECIDDAFMDEWRKGISQLDQEIQNRAIQTQQLASQTLDELQREIKVAIAAIDSADKATEISDQRVREALQAYTTIVKMDFDTPQQKLQNIQNASYFIWALYSQGSPAANMFFSDYGKEKATEVKQESNSQKAGRTTRVDYCDYVKC